MPADWPTAANAQAWLEEQPGMPSLPVGYIKTRHIAAAVRRIEALTGWTPFKGAEETRQYDPPGGFKLALDAGLLSVSSLTFGSSALVEGTNFWLKRSRTTDPAVVIEFAHIHVGPPLSISIEGLWGRMEEPDDLIWEACLMLACSEAFATYAEAFVAKSEGVDWREADASESLDHEAASVFGTRLAAEASAIVALYRRTSAYA